MDQVEELKQQDHLEQYIIVGDIGGTNFRLRLSREVLVQDKVQYYESIQELEFPVNKRQLKQVLIAHAGYQNGKFYGVGRDKGESVQHIQDHYETTNVRFLNDAEGMAQSIIAQEYLSSKNQGLFIQLKHQDTLEISNQHSKVKFLFSMGTGLGTAIVLPYPNGNPSRSFVNSSEGWASFCSVNELDERQQALGKYMFNKMKTKSSLIKLCKGQGIFLLHQFMKTQHPELDTTIEDAVKKALKAQAKATNKKEKVIINKQECITYAALNDLDPLCTKTIDFMIEIIAICIRKIALTTLPMGGIFIGGGVSNYLSSHIEKRQDIFWQHFLGEMNENSSQQQQQADMDAQSFPNLILRQIPIYVMRENPTLDGLEAMLLEEQKSD
ncbi:glucokinase [Stylonychia lemnae]|uniref:Glucokinase n=1 Tax=Stylonychia lemnae TaxID=5949 RepID=A0A078AV33_STYLE|nr:glucokinase [Stylonychia lemnae]|eukprot:CDW86064.1 glucokinase [Stylonychia lemnae]